MRPLAPGAYDAWLARARTRMVALRAPGRADAVANVDGLVASLLPDGLRSPDQHVLTGDEGEVWFSTGADPVVLDLAGEPRALLTASHDAARRAGATRMKILVFPSQPGLAAVTTELGYRPSSTRMRLDVSRPRPGPRTVALEPMTPSAGAALAEALVSSYAADLLANGRVLDAEAAAVESRRQTEEALAQPGSVVLAAMAAGRQIGGLWLDLDGDEAFVLDVVVDEAHRRHGYGRAVMVAAEDHARERGLTAVALSVFGDNVVARGLYDSLGYEVTETFLGVDL